MQKLHQAKAIISAMAQFPFMMSGMLRPVRARQAEPEMFNARPLKHTRKVKSRWLDRKDPSFEDAKKAKHLMRKQAAEAAFLLKQLLSEEETPAKQQEDSLRENYKKYQIMESVMADGTAHKLAGYYGLEATND